MTFSMMTFGIMNLIVTLSIKHKGHPSKRALSIIIECHYNECRYALRRIFIMLSVIVLSILILYVVVLSVVVPNIISVTYWAQYFRNVYTSN